MWNAAFKRLMVGLVFAHILLLCYVTVKEEYYQTGVYSSWTPSPPHFESAVESGVNAVLIIVDFYFWHYCYHAYEVPASVISLERAAMKDRRARQDGKNTFSNQLYEQPSLRVIDPTLDTDGSDSEDGAPGFRGYGSMEP